MNGMIKNIQIHINPKGKEVKPILVYDKLLLDYKLLFDYKEIKVNIPASEICVVIERFPLPEEETKKRKRKNIQRIFNSCMFSRCTWKKN